MEFSPLTFLHLACPTFRVPHPTIHDRRVKILIDRREQEEGEEETPLWGEFCVIEEKDEEEEEEEERDTRGEISQIYDSGIFLFVLIADSARRKSIFQRRVVVNWRSFREESDTAKSNWLSRSHRRAQFVTHAKAN